MKILYIINNLGSGGAEKLLEDLVPLINQFEGVQADVVLLTNKDNVFNESLQKKGINLNVLKYNNIYDPRNIFEIIKLISNEKYDVVHSHTFPTQYWVALASVFIRDKQVKFITTEHSNHNRRRNKFFLKFIENFIYSKYDIIISISENVRDKLIDWIDPNQKNRDKHIVIENGVDLEKINSAIPYCKTDLIPAIKENIRIICMVGRFYEAKDQSTLINAISKLPKNIHLILVGEGPLMNNNKILVDELGITERVHFLGFRSDIPRIIKTVDIVVLSSHWEGLSLASIEGLASGKPFIASKVNGLKEVVSGHGLLFNEGDSVELTSLINQLFSDKKFYQMIALKCVERSKKYDIQNSVNKLLEIYK